MPDTGAAPASCSPPPLRRSIQQLKEHEIIADGFLLRPIDVSHLDDHLRLVSDPRVMRFVGIEAGRILCREEVEQMVQNAVAAWKERGYGRWSVYDQYDNEFKGFCGFRCEDGKPELLAMFHERFWGTGVAYLSAKACLEYGFKKLGFNEVVSFSRPENVRARRFLEKLGARFNGLVEFHGVTGAAFTLVPPFSDIRQG